MWQLITLVYTMASTVVIGCIMVVLMATTDAYTGKQLIISAIVGAIISIPLSVVIGKRLYNMTQEKTS